MIRLGVLFGGKSGEHEVSLMSASSILRAIDRTKYTPVMIGITRDGEWLLYEGDIDDIEKDKWEESASPFKVDDLKSMIDFVRFRFCTVHTERTARCRDSLKCSIYLTQAAAYSHHPRLWISLCQKVSS